MVSMVFFFKDTATTEIYTLPLHDPLPIGAGVGVDAAGEVDGDHQPRPGGGPLDQRRRGRPEPTRAADADDAVERSEEHTSELQSRQYFVCRLLLEKKKWHE